MLLFSGIIKNVKVIPMLIENAISNASASLEMENLYVSDDLKALFLKKIKGEISMEDYVRLAMELKGVKI